MHHERVDDHQGAQALIAASVTRMLNVTPGDDNTSQSGPDDHDDVEGIPGGVGVAGTILGILIIAVGAFGNVLVILAVLMCKPLYKSSNIFLVSLAVCDLFQTVLVKPLYVHAYVEGEWRLGARVCLYALYASNIAILESILHVSVIAFYRYVIIVHPKAARCFQSRSAVIGLIVLIYILPLLIVLAPSISRLTGTSVMGKDVVFNAKIMFCSYVRHSDFRLGGVLKKVLFLSSAAVFLFYCYIRIYHSVRVSGRTISNHGGCSPCRMRREITLLKTVLVVFLSFVVAYLPISILYGVDRHRSFPDVLYFFGVMLLWSSSSVNWMIYGLMNKQYRQAYRFILCGVPLPAGALTENGSASKLSNYNVSFREALEPKDAGPRGRIGTCRGLMGSLSDEDDVSLPGGVNLPSGQNPTTDLRNTAV